MFKKFLQLNQNNKFVRKGDRILLGFSTGPDSTFLFHMLLNLKRYIDFDFSICYIDHSLRKKEVLKEIEQAELYSRKYNIKFYLKKIEVKKMSNIEDKLRKKRYEVFKNLAEKHGCNKIFTAHNRDDQIETFFLRLFRGAGGKGLSGIPERRKISDRIEIIRPVLSFSKKDIVKYLRKNKIEFLVDSSNYSVKFLRNKIRMGLIPYIKDNFGEGSLKSIFKLQKILEYESNFLDYYVDKMKNRILYFKKGNLYIARDKFLRYNKNLRMIILHRIFKGSFKLNNIMDIANLIESRKKSGKLILPLNMEVIRSRNEVIIRSRNSRKKKVSYELKLNKKKYIDYFGINIYVKKIRDLKKVDYSLSPKEKIYIDGDAVKTLVLRNRIIGDKIFIKGVGNKKIKDVLIDFKIPVWERDKIALLEVNGRIVWVVGYKRSGDFFINKNTKNILEVGVEKT